ncbi:mitochondrial calcium uniporter regulator 1 [Betta splendens]|uniref:Mitochondrial calcium uniporter regulator 1 n=1 Tax=Betta splendens TaxID=158456 RepID=A0A6P7MCV5_BETSP|nr:mitochondrial calcium uniporter regulator 1 [Betta splendens]
MVIKQCHSRLTRCVCTHPRTWKEPLLKEGRFNGRSLVPEAEMSSRTGFNTSACLQRVFSPASTNGDQQPWSRRRAAGRSAERLPARTRTALRELSTSSRALQYDLKPEVPHCEGRKLFFDTNAVVQLLEKNGFNTLQAEVIVQVLMRMTNSNMDVIYCDLVTKVQQEIMLQRIMSQIAAVKKDMIILEKSEFSALLAENEKLKIQILLLKVQLTDVMNKVRSDNILDMNVEKSRVKELKAEHEKKLLAMRTEIMEMTAEQDRHLTQTIMKIDTEVAGLKTMLESHKLDTIKYLAGSVFTCLTVVLGFYRIWM